MRFLMVGLILLGVGIGLTEYTRRHPSSNATSNSETTDAGVKKAPLSKAVATLLESETGESERPTDSPELTSLLGAANEPSKGGFTALLAGNFDAHHLAGAFGAALLIVETTGHSGVVRAEAGQPPKVLFARKQPLTALAVDGSTLFFAEGGLVASTSTRGGEDIIIRTRFKNAVVTSLAPSGDTLVVTLMPQGVDLQSTDPVGAVARIDMKGEVSLIASEQIRPRNAQADGDVAWWVAGQPSAIWRGGLDGSFTSQLTADAEEPFVLDRDTIYFRSPLGTGTELRRIGRAGGKLQTLIAADVGQLSVSSGLIRFTTQGPSPALLEMTTGVEPTTLLSLSGSGRGVALGGTTLFVLTQDGTGKSILWAK